MDIILHPGLISSDLTVSRFLTMSVIKEFSLTLNRKETSYRFYKILNSTGDEIKTENGRHPESLSVHLKDPK